VAQAVVAHRGGWPEPRVIGPYRGWRPPAKGSVLTFDTKGATAYYSQAGWSVGGGGFGQASGCAARRQGMGIGCAPLPGRWGDEGGALSPKAPRKMRTERTRSLPGGGGPDGPRRRVAAVGRDGISLSIPRADGLGKKWTERTRSLRANMKLKRLTGERPSTVQAWHRVAEGNCVAVRRSGEQPEANLSSQSSQTRRLNPIRPVGVASLRRRGEALALSLPEAITKHDHTIAKDSEGGWDEKAGKAEQLSVEILSRCDGEREGSQSIRMGFDPDGEHCRLWNEWNGCSRKGKPGSWTRTSRVTSTTSLRTG